MSEMFSRKIKHARELLRLTLEEVAEKVDSSKSYIWELENKQPARPSAQLVWKLSKVFGCSMDYLINDEVNVGASYYPERQYCVRCAKIKNILEE